MSIHTSQHAAEGTPMVDIEPVKKEFLPRSTVEQPGWSHELMTPYRLLARSRQASSTDTDAA